jgi:hypothetical protein
VIAAPRIAFRPVGSPVWRPTRAPSYRGGGGLNYFAPGAVIDYTTADLSTLSPFETTVTGGHTDEAGGLTATRTRSAATTGLHGASIPATFAAQNGQAYKCDLTFKADGRDWLLIQISGATNNAFAVVNPAAQTVGDTGGGATVEFRDLGNGWWHVRVSFTATATETVALNLFHATSGSNYSMAGDTGKGVLLSKYRASHG